MQAPGTLPFFETVGLLFFACWPVANRRKTVEYDFFVDKRSPVEVSLSCTRPLGRAGPLGARGPVGEDRVRYGGRAVGGRVKNFRKSGSSRQAFVIAGVIPQ